MYGCLVVFQTGFKVCVQSVRRLLNIFYLNNHDKLLHLTPPHCSQFKAEYIFLVCNIMWMSHFTLVVLVLSHLKHIRQGFCCCCIWVYCHNMYQFNVLCNACFLCRPVITKLTLGPLASIDYASVNLLECSPWMYNCCRGTEYCHVHNECALYVKYFSHWLQPNPEFVLIMWAFKCFLYTSF